MSRPSTVLGAMEMGRRSHPRLPGARPHQDRHGLRVQRQPVQDHPGWPEN
uniref:AFARP1 protein n=1 Tax=Homo sapiens TaxID=9606 RepID=Q8NHP2_HUMAN|nr:AFARP1 [Homo sapiens]